MKQTFRNIKMYLSRPGASDNDSNWKYFSSLEKPRYKSRFNPIYK